jgi:AcrR family transcriptional regulator
MSRNPTDRDDQSSSKAARSSRQYHHGDLRNALVIAGVEILAEEGVSGLNLRKVARRAGVSEAAPYRHFEDKQALVAAIAEDGFHRLNARMQAALETSPDDVRSRLLSLARAYVYFGLEHPAQMREMFSGLMLTRWTYPNLQAAADQCKMTTCYTILRGQEQGVIQSGDTKPIFSVFWATVHGLTMLLIEQQMQAVVEDPDRLDPLIELSIHTLCYGLCLPNVHIKTE